MKLARAKVILIQQEAVYLPEMLAVAFDRCRAQSTKSWTGLVP